MKNIYIKAMEIGFENPKGIRYDDLQKQIEVSMKGSLGCDAEYGLLEWFFAAFTTREDLRIPNYSFSESKEVLHYYRNPTSVLPLSVQDFKRAIFVIKGQATKQYIDYLELKESREQSRMAYKTSLWSIGIAMITLLASILFAVLAKQPEAHNLSNTRN